MKKIVIAITTAVVLFSCDGVRQVSLSNEQFYSNEHVEDKISKYNVYFHNGESTFRLENPEMINDSLAGDPVPVDPKTINENPKTPQELFDTRNDVHVYLDKEDKAYYESKIANGEKIKLGRKEIKEVKMLAKDEGAAFAAAGLVILFVLLGILIISLLIVLLASAADKGTDGSGSGSDSDSGDSGDSGGSNSDSGCYIATMVYGSYEAPKVMVLRAFRDQFLAKYSWGNKFIGWYYANSPKFVSKHKNHKILGSIIRGVLNAVVWCLKPFFKA